MHLVIIGSGLAGYNVAKEFRKYDAVSMITMVTMDDGTYYSKPMLSSAFTTNKTPETLPLGDVATMQEQLSMQIKTKTIVLQIDSHAKQVITDQGKIDYDQCVIACGASVIPAPLTGSGAAEVFHVNNLTDYRAFRSATSNKKRVALLGAGLIGCEFANDMRNADYDVDCIALSKTPLDRLLPKRAGVVLQNALADCGVTWHLEQRIDDIEKTDHSYAVTLSGGEVIHVDVVLSAIGIRPEIQFAETSNIVVNNGIVVNAYCETSVKDIYALGDCAEVSGMVLQYVAPLLQCSRALAKTLSGERTAVSYHAMPIVIKTPAHPVVVTPPPVSTKGDWHIDIEDDGVIGRFVDAADKLQGFILMNKQVKRRAEFLKEMPVWL